MDFLEDGVTDFTVGCKEKGSLTRGRNIALVKGIDQGTEAYFHASKTHGSHTFSGYVKQRKRKQIRLNPKSW